MESTKRCPYCAETILSAAIKCKHCGSALTDAPTQPLAEATSRADYGWALLSIPIIGVLLLGGWVANLSMLQGPGSAANLVLLFVIAGTAAIAGLEASKLGMKYDRSEGTYNSVQWAATILLLWIIGYPTYLFKRRRYGRSNLLVPGIAVSLLFVGSIMFTFSQIDTKTAELRRSLDNLQSATSSLSASDASAPPQPVVEAARLPAAPSKPVASAPPHLQAASLFDIVAYCKSISAAVGGSYQVEAGCREQEAAAKSALSARKVPPDVMTYCHSVAEAVGGSYQVMSGCVDQELAAKSKL